MRNDANYSITVKNRAGMMLSVEVFGNNKNEAVGKVVSFYPDLFLKVIKTKENK
tara:strand:- start:261 stop:422 length:162 start_codon:yes stop_codon:yes gene_type:complete